MALEKFHYTTHDNTEIVVPFAFDAIRRKAFKKIQADFKDDSDGMDDALMEAAGFDAKTMGLIDDMSIRDYQAFVQGWMQSEGATVGES